MQNNEVGEVTLPAYVEDDRKTTQEGLKRVAEAIEQIPGVLDAWPSSPKGEDSESLGSVHFVVEWGEFEWKPLITTAEICLCLTDFCDAIVNFKMKDEFLDDALFSGEIVFKTDSFNLYIEYLKKELMNDYGFDEIAVEVGPYKCSTAIKQLPGVIDATVSKSYDWSKRARVYFETEAGWRGAEALKKLTQAISFLGEGSSETVRVYRIAGADGFCGDFVIDHKQYAPFAEHL
jgi:hypothetical protein